MLAVQHDCTPKKILEALAYDPDPDIRQAVLDNHDIEIFEQFAEEVNEYHEESLERNQSQNPSDSLLVEAEILSSYSLWTNNFNSDVEFLDLIEESKNLSAQSLEQLAEDYDFRVRAAVARNINTPKFVLTKLSEDSNTNVLLAVADNLNTPIAVLEKLSVGNNGNVAQVSNNHLPAKWIAEANCEETSLERLHKLARNSHWQVRLGVAKNINTPIKILELLAQDEEESINQAASLHPKAQKEISELIQRLENLESVSQDFNELSNCGFSEVRVVIANRVDCPIQVLEKLSKDNSSKVRKACVQNPQTPVECLYQLGAEYPKEFLENFTTQLLLIDTLKIYQELPRETRLSLAKEPSCPHELLKYLADDPDWEIRQALVSNPNLPKPVLEKLAADSDGDVLREIAKHSSFKMLIEEAKNPDTSVERLEELSTCIFYKVREAVANNDKLPISTLINLAKDDDENVQEAVSSHPYVQKIIKSLQIPRRYPQRLHDLASSVFVGVRKAVAAHEDILPLTLKKLSEDESFKVRIAIIENPKISTALLKKLARDQSWEVRLGVASNKKISASLLRQLATDSDCDVREAVASNELTPLEVLEILATDSNFNVRDAVYANPNASKELRRQIEIINEEEEEEDDEDYWDDDDWDIDDD